MTNCSSSKGYLVRGKAGIVRDRGTAVTVDIVIETGHPCKFAMLA